MQLRIWWIKYNKSIEKSLSNIHKNKNNRATPGKQQINKEKNIIDNNIQIIGEPKNENKITINTYSNNHINTINAYKYTNSNYKTESDEIYFTKKMKCFIISLNYIKPLPFPMEVLK